MCCNEYNINNMQHNISKQNIKKLSSFNPTYATLVQLYKYLKEKMSKFNNYELVSVESSNNNL